MSWEKEKVSGAVASAEGPLPHCTGDSEIQRSHLKFQYCQEPLVLNLRTNKPGIMSSHRILRA